MPTTVRFRVGQDELDAAEEALWGLGAQAVTVSDAADQPLLEPGPGETPVWEHSIVEAMLPDALDPEHALRALIDQGAIADAGDAELVDIPDRDWERAWMDRFEPMRFGTGIWICPWHIDPDPDWPLVVRLDPGLAFGTGTHATTALCLEWIDGQDFAGRHVIDYGCGSGVLGIAAALKGADRVVAVDHDPQALDATRENAECNGVSAAVETALPDSFDGTAADIVLANILAGPLVELAERIAGLVAPGGALVLSGILAEQADEVEQAYAPLIEPVGQDTREGWVRLDFRR